MEAGNVGQLSLSLGQVFAPFGMSLAPLSLSLGMPLAAQPDSLMPHQDPSTGGIVASYVVVLKATGHKLAIAMLAGYRAAEPSRFTSKRIV